MLPHLPRFLGRVTVLLINRGRLWPAATDGWLLTFNDQSTAEVISGRVTSHKIAINVRLYTWKYCHTVKCKHAQPHRTLKQVSVVAVCGWRSEVGYYCNRKKKKKKKRTSVSRTRHSFFFNNFDKKTKQNKKHNRTLHCTTTHEKLGRSFGKDASEWTGRTEISKEEYPGSKCSMHGNILTYSRL